MLRLGIDCGSTTLKVVVLDNNEIKYKKYVRHNADITAALIETLKEVKEQLGEMELAVTFTGSAGFKIATDLGVMHTQEVIAATNAIIERTAGVDVCIELGGEDAKVIFFDRLTPEQRMNGACAGGTGAFIDQMASLLDTDPTGVNEFAKGYTEIYPIAARCGVFAKTDVQPLLNQGVSKEDISASIFQAVVNQTIAGLAQGKKIRGRVCFLGGPLTFMSELRKRFIETLELKEDEVVLPDDSQIFMAIGAALTPNDEVVSLDDITSKLIDMQNKRNFSYKKVLPRLFNNQEELDSFIERHNKAKVEFKSLVGYKGKVYLGIDCGSTTTKAVLINEEADILYSYYSSNKGTPVQVVKNILTEIYSQLDKDAVIAGVISTGYGEKLVENAFSFDKGLVETMCHYRAARHFKPNVDFIIDIGGQDMKCFKISNGHMTSIILNEACSSGCGSFIETFAKALNYEVKDFATIGLLAENPIDLGSKCTVFMNSSVKSAQKEGASPADISAGLAYSVVKNSLYKVIRVNDVKADCGENIIVQGGTFYNNAILRAFELETNTEVVRPNIAGLMGAFGAALNARDLNLESSKVISKEDLENFSYSSRNLHCNKCPNNCLMTMNIFGEGKRYISGNRCEKGVGITLEKKLPNLYEYKFNKLYTYKGKQENYKGTVGIPVVLNMYENIPFWGTFFEVLGYKVELSPRSTKELYEYGQQSIPSDTACYPAKIVHGHIEKLRDSKVDYIFYPNMPFNLKEKEYATNHYNCPVVANYPELINVNVENLSNYIMPYIALGYVSKKEGKPFENPVFVKRMYEALKPYLKISKGDVKKAYAKGLQALKDYKLEVQEEGQRALAFARENNKQIIVLAGRPYHIDPEINHGIDKLLTTLDCVVLSEDAINHLAAHKNHNVLNQWAYHTRLYDAASWVVANKDAELVQLVSFGCGLDSITTDEVKDVLESKGKFYTQLKIDEISNLGAVTIRIRSLLESRR